MFDLFSRTEAKRRKRKTGLSGRQAGLTLAETLMVIAVGAVAIVSGTMLFMISMKAHHINSTTNGLQALRTEVSALFTTSQSGGNGEDITATVIRGGQVPPDFLAGDHLEHRWDGEIVITSQGRNFDISFEALPDDVCVQLFSKAAVGAGSNSSSIVHIDVGGTMATPPFQPGFAAEHCNGGGTDVTWRFRK